MATPSKKNLILWRFFEILPGALIWTSFVLPILLSFIIPAVVATYVLIFDLYWLFKSFLFGFYLILGYNRMVKELKINWYEKLIHQKPTDKIKDWNEIYQAIIFPSYKESYETLDASIRAVAESSFPAKKIIVVLAIEERSGQVDAEIAKKIERKYRSKFFEFLITEHPDGIVGENKAKGANATWAAKNLRKFLDEKNLEYDNVIVTTADADSRVHHQYFACLAYKYVTTPNRDRASFQPIPLYSNNIWQAPAISRIVAFGNAFWQMIEACRPWRLITFATHAMSMKTLIDINYWAVEVVNEDSRQFWRAYFKYNGDFTVVPMFTPIYMDAVLADGYWQTIKNQYLQKQRWAYGAEHLPYVFIESFKNHKIPFADKVVRCYRMLEGLVSWGTASIYVAGVAWLPIIFGPGFKNTVLGDNLMVIIRSLMVLTWIGIIISVYVSLLLLPKRPPQFRRRKILEMIAQWVLMPVQAIIFSSFPAIDAQTRLMLGKYLTFRVTEKKAVTTPIVSSID